MNGIGSIILVLVVVGGIWFVSVMNDGRQNQTDELMKLGCGDLKELIAVNKWEGFHKPWAEIDGPRIYEWTCEK